MKCHSAAMMSEKLASIIVGGLFLFLADAGDITAAFHILLKFLTGFEEYITGSMHAFMMMITPQCRPFYMMLSPRFAT